MKLSKLHTEGVVAAARGDIINIVNDLASKITRSAKVIFGGDRRMAALLNFIEPQVEFSDEEDQPAVVMLRLGGRTPETVSVTVFGDGGGEIKLEMSERLSRLLSLPRHATLSSLEDVNQKLSEVAAIIKDKLGSSSRVNNPNQAQVGGAW